MIALVAILAVLLVAVVLIAAVALINRDETIRQLKAQRICDVLEVRKMRTRIAEQEQMLNDTELAAGVAREVIGQLEPMETPIFDGLVADAEEREATVLQFRRDLEGWGGTA